MFRLLHLSDLHFGSECAYRTNDNLKASLGTAIKSAISKCNINIDGVIVTGDLFGKSQPTDLPGVERGVGDLIQHIEIGPGYWAFVPGNHDLYWDETNNPLYYYDILLGKLSVGHGKPVPSGFPQIVKWPNSDGTKPLGLILIDSCRVESKPMSGIGCIGEDQLRLIEKKMKEEGLSAETHILVAALHHHLLPIAHNQEIHDSNNPSGGAPARISITEDAVEVLRRLSNLGIRSFLHGHQHKQAVLKYANLTNSDPEVFVICAGSAGIANTTRHFFLHEIDDTEWTVRSFTSLHANPELFREEEKTQTFYYSLPEETVNKIDTICINEHNHKRVVDNWHDKGQEDYSDLFYLFLTVVDCDESRKIVRSLMRALKDTREWAKQRPGYIKLCGMYDLLGRWDLAIRMRISKGCDPRPFIDLVKDKLSDGKMICKDGKGNKVNTQFNLRKTVNIKSEQPISDWLEGRPKEERLVEIARQCFRSAEQYDEFRCQRGILFIDKAEPNLILALRDVIKKNADVQQIIESVSESDGSIIFETFMTCSQSAMMNKLNRIIEGSLTSHGAQKATLLCYGYDEDHIECLAD